MQLFGFLITNPSVNAAAFKLLFAETKITAGKLLVAHEMPSSRPEAS